MLVEVAPSSHHCPGSMNVPASNRFRHSQKPPSSQISAFSFFRSRLTKMKQSPRYGSACNSSRTTSDNVSMPRRMS
jgi:hypothetical protein